MNIVVSQAPWPRMDDRPTEMVERKGLGHPDTICDNIAERFSRNLCRFYLENAGHILHHNVDKALLVGGAAVAEFGYGEIIEPMRLILCGRATPTAGGRKVPLGSLAIQAAREWLRENLPYLPDDGIIIDYMVRPGSDELRQLVEGGAPLANDTSLGVGYAPLSETERLVLAIEKKVRSFQPIGQDVKVMALRKGNHITVTVAAAFISELTPDLDTYLATTAAIGRAIRELAATITSRDVTVCVNCADNAEKGQYYLTVTGTSAEMGDDGQVGRGNRANGLITPFRSMSLEAVAGKNPVSHVGKIYNAMAQRIADLVADRIPGSEVVCYMLSQIGKPITEPQVVHLEGNGASEAELKEAADEIVPDVLNGWREIQESFVRGDCPVC
ncbi:MAG: methionine adenosyltransferase [Armatimonadetes bacterium]|nr:methionine adenosyltransferase [Armatimonadota bacterium]